VKFSVEIELDYLDEDDCLDESIKKQILAAASNKIVSAVMNELETSAKEIAVKRIDEEASIFVNNCLEKYVDGPIKLTDNYGGTIAEHDGIDELLKSKFDEFMAQKVDQYGKPSNSCSRFDKTYTNLDYMLDAKVKKVASESIDKMMKGLDKKIRESSEAEAKKQLNERILKQFNAEEMLKNMEGK